MASRSLGTLYVDFMARTGGLETDMGRAARISKQRAKEIDKAIAGAARTIGSTLTTVGAAAAAGFGAVTLVVKNAIDELDRIGKTAQKIGVSTEALSALEYAAKLADVSAQTLQSSITKLAKAQSDAAQGGKQQIETFRLLGVEFQNADGTLRDADAVFSDVAEAFATMEDGAGKTALAVKLFGRAGAELIPLLNAGRDGIRSAREEAEQFGIIVSGEAAKAAEQFNDNMTRLGEVSRGAGLELATYLLPVINELADEAISLAKDPAFREDLALAIKTIGEAAIAAARGLVALTNAFGTVVGAGKMFFNIVEDDNLAEFENKLGKVREQLALLERGNGTEAQSPLAAALRAQIVELEAKRDAAQAILSARNRSQLIDQQFQEVDPRLIPPKKRLDAPEFVDTAEADRAAKEAARAARDQAKQLAEDQKQYTQIVRDLKLQALGDEARAVAALQDQYGDLKIAVELGVVSQQDAAEIAAGLAEQWQEGATKSIRLELLTEEQRSVEELQAKYIELQNLVASGALTPEQGAGFSAQFAEKWAEEQQALHDQQFEALSAGLLSEEEEIAASYERRREAILEATKLTEDEKTDLLVRAEADRQQQLADLERARLNEGLDQTAYYLGAVSTLMQSGNSKLFAIGKAAAIAEATVKGYQAVVNALAEVPYPLNFAAAAAVGAATAVQIANIASTNYSGAYDVGGDIPAAAVGLVAERGPEIVRVGGDTTLIREPTLIEGPAHITSRVQTDRILRQQQEGLRFAGMFDTGGFIPAGSVGLVGERGPELAAMSAAVPGRASMTAQLDRASAAAEPPKIRQVIVFSDDQIADALGSDASEQKLITWATRNRTKLRSILA